VSENKPFLSIVIPAYNEEKRLPGTLDNIISYLQTKPYTAEIIVVDDGCKDNTKKVAESFISQFPNLRVVDYGQNRGKGYAVRFGMLQAKGDIVLFSDSDLSTPIEELEKFLPKFEEGYDIVIGSRALKDSIITVSQPWYRVFMGKTFNLIVRTLFWTRITDTQCGFKAFTRKAVQDIFPRQTVFGFGFDVEVLFIGKKLGYKIAECPVIWENSEDSRVSAIKDSIKMFWDLLVIRNRLRGIK
jgi:dolichyl-phosphate beta-glucosyltransferase